MKSYCQRPLAVSNHVRQHNSPHWRGRIAEFIQRRLCFNQFSIQALRIQVCPKNPGLHRSIPILSRSDWKPKNPTRSERVWILGEGCTSIEILKAGWLTQDKHGEQSPTTYSVAGLGMFCHSETLNCRTQTGGCIKNGPLKSTRYHAHTIHVWYIFHVYGKCR